MKKIAAPHLPPKSKDIKSANAKADRAAHKADLLTTLHFTCRDTGKSFDHDVPSDAASLTDLWSQRIMLNCPHCHEVHGFPFRAAYVRAILEEPRQPCERIYGKVAPAADA